jgi:hypothetical protein
VRYVRVRFVDMRRYREFTGEPVGELGVDAELVTLGKRCHLPENARLLIGGDYIEQIPKLERFVRDLAKFVDGSLAANFKIGTCILWRVPVSYLLRTHWVESYFRSLSGVEARREHLSVRAAALEEVRTQEDLKVAEPATLRRLLEDRPHLRIVNQE